MLPASNETPPSYQRYTAISRWSLVDGKKVLQYGLEQLSLDGNGNTIKVAINDISDDRQVVNELINRLKTQDVDCESISYIVDDYINEIAML